MEPAAMKANRNIRYTVYPVLALALIMCVVQACGRHEMSGQEQISATASIQPLLGQPDRAAVLRLAMVQHQIEVRGVRDAKTLAAMRHVPRHLFVPKAPLSTAYGDHPVPIGNNQTISQPYIVAFMTEALELQGGEKVLEIGTGSGYQAAVIAEIARRVYTIEIVEPLGRRARTVLDQCGYTNIEFLIGDGYRGWPEHAPFDAIIVTAAPDHIPQPLIEQLKPGGRMVIPVGEFAQQLLKITKRDSELHYESLLPVRFVPMTGKAMEE